MTDSRRCRARPRARAAAPAGSRTRRRGRVVALVIGGSVLAITLAACGSHPAAQGLPLPSTSATTAAQAKAAVAALNANPSYAAASANQAATAASAQALVSQAAAAEHAAQTALGSVVTSVEGSQRTTPAAAGVTPTSHAPSTVGASATGTQPAVPSSGAYLGAFVNPTGGGGSTSQVATFESEIGRSLGVDNHYYMWNTLMPGPAGTFDQQHGSIPMLSWACSSSATDAEIAAGDDDTWITTEANSVKAFGAPVLIRWFWEMDLNSTTTDGCEGTPGAAAGPSYIAAFQRIVTLFRAAGATNAAFVWCPSSYAFATTYPSGGGAANFYPGAGYVDWVAEDIYDKAGTSTTPAAAVAPFYDSWSGSGKPLMIAETGAIGSDQVPWLQEFGSEMPSDPAIKSVVYFDAPVTATNSSWEFGSDGVSEFATLGKEPYFSPLG